MLNSIKEANQYHKDWELAILDDNSSVELKPIIDDLLPEFSDQIRIERTDFSFEDKLQFGLKLGQYANTAMRESNADIGILLCDDDELCPKYLFELSEYFEKNPKVKHCYSNIYLYNPLHSNAKLNAIAEHKYNQWVGDINPVGKVDASQVAWRLTCCKEEQAWFEETTKNEHEPFIIDTDYRFFNNLYSKCGTSSQSNLFAQYKGIHEYQLVWNKKSDNFRLRNYFNIIEELANNELL